MTELILSHLEPQKLPFTHVDALLVLGIGGNTRLLGPDRHPVIEEQRMRINAVAAKELAAHHNITSIIPTGQFTELVEYHYKRLAARQQSKPDPTETDFLSFQGLMGQPTDEAELRRAAAVSQGELMSSLIRRAVPKGGAPSRLTQEILEERIARNTILNFIEALNLLDERTKGFWQGNMAVLTTNTGHLQRSLAIGRLLALGEILPISSEGTLLHYGYDKEYLNYMLQVTDSELREQEKNLRALSEIPEFIIPELVYIKNDERLRKVLSHLSGVYGPQALAKFGIENIESMPADSIRKNIRQVGENRTQTAFDALPPGDRKELKIDQFDPVKDIDQIRKVLASDVKATEMVRKALIAKYDATSGWFEENGLADIETTEAYRIKNWFFGRRLPPNAWRDTAKPELWREQNDRYNKMTDAWIDETGREKTL